jgi:hypothetical protein
MSASIVEVGGIGLCLTAEADTKIMSVRLVPDGRDGLLVYLAALSARYGIRFRSVPITAQNKPESVHLIRSLFRDGQISTVANHPHSAECKRQWLGYRRTTKSGGGFSYGGGSRSAVDDWAACLVTLGASMLVEEQGTPADQTRLVMDGAVTNKRRGGRHEVPYLDASYARNN